MIAQCLNVFLKQSFQSTKNPRQSRKMVHGKQHVAESNKHKRYVDIFP